MKKARKLFGAVLAIAMIFNIFAIAAVAETKDVAQVDVSLQVGWYDAGTRVFTPLAPGEEILQDEEITVRVVSESNFCVGGQNYPVMFDKLNFEVVGEAKAAFTVNSDQDNMVYNFDTLEYDTLPGYTGNTYYDYACSSYAGATVIGDDVWPASFAAGERFDVYKVVQANFVASSSSNSGGYPRQLPGDWLFQFNLKALQDIVSGSDARIFIDNRWFRTPESTNLPGYITKYDDCNDLISNQGLYSLSFDRDFTGADITLPTEATTSTITFVTGDGTVVVPLTGNIGDPVVVPANPTRTNYAFKGWDVLPATFPADDLNVTAEWIMLGDVNLDGEILASDALMALRAGNESIVLTGDAAIAADVNQDGIIIASDALMILRFSNGAITVFP